MARTNAWLEPWFLNAKLAYHRAVAAELQQKLIKNAIDGVSILNALTKELREQQVMEQRLQEVTRG